MSYTYDIATSKKDIRSTVALSVCHILHTIIKLFLSTFLIAHIYSFCEDIYTYAANVALYQMFTYIAMFISYYILSFFVDKTNRVWIYRVANIIESILVVVSIFFGKDLAKIVILAGCLNGLSHGSYYSSYNVLRQEMVSRKSIKNFTVIISVLAKLVNIVCPIILGALIEVSTFSMVAIYVLVLCFIQLIVSFLIRSKKPVDSDFKLGEYFKKIKSDPMVKKKIGKLYIIGLFYGFVTIVSSLLSVNIMMQFGSSFSLGAMTSVFAVVAIVVLLLMRKFTKMGGRTWLYILISSFLVVSAMVLSIIPNLITLIIYHLAFSIFEVIVATNYDIHRNSNMKELGLYQDIAEHQCVVESCFGISRILSFGLLFILSLFKNNLIYQIGFIVFIVLLCVTAILLAKYEKDNKE